MPFGDWWCWKGLKRAIQYKNDFSREENESYEVGKFKIERLARINITLT